MNKFGGEVINKMPLLRRRMGRKSCSILSLKINCLLFPLHLNGGGKEEEEEHKNWGGREKKCCSFIHKCCSGPC